MTNKYAVSRPWNRDILRSYELRHTNIDDEEILGRSLRSGIKRTIGRCVYFHKDLWRAFTSDGCKYKGVQGVDRHRTWQVKDLDLFVS